MRYILVHVFVTGIKYSSMKIASYFLGNTYISKFIFILRRAKARKVSPAGLYLHLLLHLAQACSAKRRNLEGVSKAVQCSRKKSKGALARGLEMHLLEQDTDAVINSGVTLLARSLRNAIRNDGPKGHLIIEGNVFCSIIHPLTA